MLYLLPGVVAFLLFYLYEYVGVTHRFPFLRLSFFVGVLLLFFSTAAAGLVRFLSVPLSLWRLLLFGVPALACLLLMLYALFFAVPFAETYIDTEKKPSIKVCRTGMYALCRHPGVLWFVGFYLFLWLALGGAVLLGQFLLYSLLNLIYIVIQDRWSFLLCFADYADYKKSVPFLVPTKKSLRCCLKSFHAPNT